MYACMHDCDRDVPLAEKMKTVCLLRVHYCLSLVASSAPVFQVEKSVFKAHNWIVAVFPAESANAPSVVLKGSPKAGLLRFYELVYASNVGGLLSASPPVSISGFKLAHHYLSKA